MSYFSEKLYELRKEKGFSQEELAEKLNVARQTISKWENGTTNPDTNNLIELSKIFGISIDEFVGNDEFIKKDDNEENKDLKNINKKKKIIKRVIIIVLILLFLIYLVMIGIRWGIVYIFRIDLVKKELNDVKQYGYKVSEIGFENGMNKKWDFSEAQRYEDKLIIEHYTTNFTMDKTQYEPDKIRVEFYDGEDYYDIDLINKTYTKAKNAYKDEIFYNVTTFKLDAEIGKFFINQEFRIFNLFGWRFVFDFSNSIKIIKQENGGIAYDVRLKDTIDGVNNFSLLRDSTGRCTNILVTTDNGSRSVMDYKSTMYDWYTDDLDSSKVKLPDLTGFTLIEE